MATLKLHQGEYSADLLDTLHPNTLYDEQGNPVAIMYGIASNMSQNQLGMSDAKGMDNARTIVASVNGYAEMLEYAEQVCEVAKSLYECCSILGKGVVYINSPADFFAKRNEAMVKAVELMPELQTKENKDDK